MNFHCVFLLVLLVLIGSPIIVSAREGKRKLQEPSHPDAIVPDNFIVQFSPTVQDVNAEADDLAKKFPKAKVEVLEGVFNGAVMTGINSTALEKLENIDEVAKIFHNSLIRRANNPIRVQSDASWGLASIDRKGGKIDTEYRYDEAGGTGVVVYIMDSGVINFPSEYEGRYNVSGCIDFTEEKDCTKPEENYIGHGTFVAGIVGSKTHGVAKNVEIENFKVLDIWGGGYWDDVIEALNEVMKRVEANPHKKHVINMSFAGWKFDEINNIIKEMVAQGVVAVAAAGNDYMDACILSPASEPSVITVASSNSRYESGITNWGPCVDVFAPGDSVSSWHQDGSVAVESGTSFATPYVAGVAALYLSRGKTTADMLADAERNVVINVVDSTPNLLINTENILPRRISTLRPSRRLTNRPSMKDCNFKDAPCEYDVDCCVGRCNSISMTCASSPAEIHRAPVT